MVIVSVPWWRQSSAVRSSSTDEARIFRGQRGQKGERDARSKEEWGPPLLPPRGSARRRSHHGLAVARIISKLRRRHFRTRLSEAFRGSVHGKWSERGLLGRPGLRDRHGSQQDHGAARTAEAQDQRDPRSFPQAIHGSRHSSGADGRSALGREHSEGSYHQSRRHGGSGARPAHRAGYGSVQHFSGFGKAES